MCFPHRQYSYRCVSPTASIHIDPSFHKVAFEIQIEDLSETAFTEELERYQQLAFANVVYINHHVRDFNACLKGQIEDRFTERYNVSLNEKRVFTAINVVKTKQADVIAVPVIQRKVVIQPKTHQSESYADEPTLRQDIYEDVLSVLYNVGKSLERKPSLYLSKGEEQLRDLFLLFLETRYEAITATGETFNRMGKTDILLRYSVDGSNLFIAECKIWKGQAEYLKAIDQLLGYLTWRDSKASVILFVRQNEFSSVLSKIVQSTPQHPNFHKETGKRGESSFSYKFNLPQDKNKQIYLEIIAFHFDTKFESEVRELRLK
ncbi:hypothetical protein [Spirosoma agri]|uniref:Uncharacterized protein n=1 Tax=Spirosoma agri TaxID=1987381 RepID=A0A6M0IHY0_9BACT|nr:hypothetical protein [Spirosoma agri]NEU66931.1 hypothetical protein [Spirosoma agri]